MIALRHDYEVFIRSLLKQTKHRLPNEWKGIKNLTDHELLSEINAILKENHCLLMSADELNRNPFIDNTTKK